MVAIITIFFNAKEKFMSLFDLSKNNVGAANEAGFEFELVMPGSGEATGAFIKVRGEQSPSVKNYGRRLFTEYQMKQTAAKRRGKEYDIDLDEAEETGIQSAVVRIISWRNIAENGKEIEFNKENAERILKEHSWIKEQVMEESSQALNFRPK